MLYIQQLMAPMDIPTVSLTLAQKSVFSPYKFSDSVCQLCREHLSVPLPVKSLSRARHFDGLSPPTWQSIFDEPCLVDSVTGGCETPANCNCRSDFCLRSQRFRSLPGRLKVQQFPILIVLGRRQTTRKHKHNPVRYSATVPPSALARKHVLGS